MALEQLPWKEIDAKGPILVLIVPTVMREVDGKKSHARRFNRMLRPLLEGEGTVVVRASPVPRVDLALADCCTVDWAKYADLDPGEADSRVVAEALSFPGPSHESRLIVSQDIRPLHLARRHSLNIHQIGENWLRPKEVTESEKKAANLQRQIDAMKTREPQLVPKLSVSKPTVDVHRVELLSVDERRAVQETIIGLNPMPEQKPSSHYLSFANYDHSLEDRYKMWAIKKVPHFVSEYERNIEVNFGQLQISFRLENIGQVPAESLLIRLTATGGWLSNKYVLANPSGPSVPTPRHFSNQGIHMPRSVLESMRSAAQPGKHEFKVLDEPKRSSEVQIACADFRHGLTYEYTVVGRADPHADEFRIDAVVTTGNLYGEVKTSLLIPKNVEYSSIEELINLETMRFRVRPHVDSFLEKAISAGDYSAFEFQESGE